MRTFAIEKSAVKFVDALDAKQFRQVVRKVLALLSDPQPADSGKLKGYPYWRVDIGEYRIVYDYNDEVVHIILIDRRNDDEVYKALARL